MDPEFAAIGSSDFHFGAGFGECRTFVFVETVDDLLDKLKNDAKAL